MPASRPENKAAACGILNTGGNLGGMLAPVITPLIASRFGWAAGLYFACLVVLPGMLVWLWIDPAPAIKPHLNEDKAQVIG